MKINEVLDASDAEAAKAWYEKNTYKSHGLYVIDDGNLEVVAGSVGYPDKDVIYKHNVKEVPFKLNARGHDVSFLDLDIPNFEKFVMPTSAGSVSIEHCTLDDLNGLENLMATDHESRRNVLKLLIEETSITDGTGLPDIVDRLIIRKCASLKNLSGGKLHKVFDELSISECAQFNSIDGLPAELYHLGFDTLPQLTSLSGIGKIVKKCHVIWFGGHVPIQSGAISLMKIGAEKIIYDQLKGPDTQNFKKALDIITKHLPNNDIAEAMDELMEAGLKDFAKP
jgi:hypothetical protein